MLSRTVKDRRYGVSDWKGEPVKHRMLQWRWGTSYPVGVSSVGTRQDVQQVVAVSRCSAAGLVGQSTVGPAAGAFVTLLERREHGRLR